MRETTIIPTFEIYLFGGFEARIDGRPLPPLRSRKEQWLLALLVLRHDRDTSREWLAATLWPDSDGEQSLFYLRKSLSNLRKALAGASSRLVSPSPRTVRLDLTGAIADVIAFDSALTQAAGSGNPADLLQKAVALYSGPLLPECSEEWAIIERTQREQAYLAGLESLAVISQDRRDGAAAVRWLRLLVTSDPYRESAYRAMLQALSDCGDRAAIQRTYSDLRIRLRSDLNSSPAPETEALYKRLMSLESSPAAPARPNPAAVRRNLPVPLSDLIGREVETTAILDWMKRRRLLTLVGSGGVGKTRLAIAVAEHAIDRFDQGVWFVDLAPISDPALVLPIIASAVGINEEQRRPLIETLPEALTSQSMLLVLDNCEHLQDAPASAAHLLLTSCPCLSIVATSRQALGVTGEQVYRVPSLLVPPAELGGMEKDPHALMKFDSIRLFVDRSSRVDGMFRLNHRNAPAVVEICRKLDGIPLAIEMAAARMRSISASEIDARLTDRFRVLTTGNRGALPRHQTLRAAIDWSYDLLDDLEKALFCRMSVFSGGCELESAVQVCAIEPLEQRDIGQVLASLSDKSLVTAEQHNDATRYRLLETVREYARERLRERGESESISARHQQHYLSMIEDAETKLMGPRQAEWLDRLDQEYENLRTGLEWSLCPDAVIRMCGALQRYWWTRGYYSEGRAWCMEALRNADTQSRTRERAKVLNVAGVLAYAQGDHLTARSYHFESLTIRRELGDWNDIASSLNNLGNVAYAQGELIAAKAYLEESLAILKEIGNWEGTASPLTNLGNISLRLRDYDRAKTYIEDGLAIQREIGHADGIANSLTNLGNCEIARGDFESARVHFEESAAILTKVGNRSGIADAFQGFADLAARDSRFEQAVSLWAAAEDLRVSTGVSVLLHEREQHDREVAAARRVLGEAAFSEARETGRTMTVEDLIEYARTRR